MGQEPSKNRVIVPARQATQAGGIDFWAPDSERGRGKLVLC
jgi:hypothetical protein